MNYRYYQLTLLIFLATAMGSASAKDYEEGRSAYINGQYQHAYDILLPLAEAGDSEAQKMMGIMYDYGHGVPIDKNKALNWYIKSAEQGQPAVQYQVGAKYFQGDGVEQNYLEAAKWWELAANGGQIDAQFNLGLMYFRGMVLAQDDAEAARLFQQAAEQGHSHAQYSLAVMYAFGRGVTKDYQTALKWFNQSAEQGVSQAQFNLGVFYENGHGVERNIATAKQWYERAAAQGLAQAANKLAALETSGAEAPTATGITDIAAEYSTAELSPDGIKRENWVLAQKPNAYTLQIGSVVSEEAIVNFIKNNHIESETAYIEVEIKGTTRYNALYGSYPTYAEAELAVDSLSTVLRGVKPWIRNFGVLHKLIKQTP